jgi:hypothetical protein
VPTPYQHPSYLLRVIISNLGKHYHDNAGSRVSTAKNHVPQLACGRDFPYLVTTYNNCYYKVQTTMIRRGNGSSFFVLEKTSLRLSRLNQKQKNWNTFSYQEQQLYVENPCQPFIQGHPSSLARRRQPKEVWWTGFWALADCWSYVRVFELCYYKEALELSCDLWYSIV